MELSYCIVIAAAILFGQSEAASSGVDQTVSDYVQNVTKAQAAGSAVPPLSFSSASPSAGNLRSSMSTASDGSTSPANSSTDAGGLLGKGLVFGLKLLLTPVIILVQVLLILVTVLLDTILSLVTSLLKILPLGALGVTVVDLVSSLHGIIDSLLHPLPCVLGQLSLINFFSGSCSTTA